MLYIPLSILIGCVLIAWTIHQSAKYRDNYCTFCEDYHEPAPKKSSSKEQATIIKKEDAIDTFMKQV